MKESDIMNGIILSLGRPVYTARELIDLSSPFGITEGRVRTWLSRRASAGFLERDDRQAAAAYRLSDKGRRIAGNVSLSFRDPDWSTWDGKWFGFAFSVPEQHSRERRRLRVKLESYRFAKWFKGLWIRPAHPEQNIPENFIDSSRGRLIRFESMTQITREEVQQLWNLHALKSEYDEALTNLDTAESDLASITPLEAHVRRIETGNLIVPLLFKDPLLPPLFLPDGWSGGILKKRFSQWDAGISKKAAPFWNSVVSKNKNEKEQK